MEKLQESMETSDNADRDSVDSDTVSTDNLGSFLSVFCVLLGTQSGGRLTDLGKSKESSLRKESQSEGKKGHKEQKKEVLPYLLSKATQHI